MWKFIQDNRELTIVFAIGLLFTLLSLGGSGFHLQTLAMIFNSAQIVILLAIGATFVILTRNIDVSVGSTMGLCAVIAGSLLNAGFGASAFVITLCCGLLAGLFNGILVTLLRIPAIVATLGTLGLYKGIMLLITGGKWIEGLPQDLKTLSAPAFLHISPIGWLLLGLIGLTYFFLTKMKAGRDFYAVGDNLQGALQLGVRVNQVRIAAFAINGTMAALAGIVFASQIGFVPNSTGNGLEMKAIAACVLGGISLLGGAGNIIGAVLGAYFLIQIDSILVFVKSACLLE
ncbi:autoinducer 2 ABC transporter permease LsrC [Pasteurella multocida]|nr:autoinducer 2 ABC transporter permease LsrC [Pasteurella multocida]